MELGIRPVACAQYVNEYMPHFIMSGRKQNSRAHKKQRPSEQQLEPLIESPHAGFNRLRPAASSHQSNRLRPATALLRSQSAPQPLVDSSSRRGSVGSCPPTAAASAGKLAPAASAASAAASTRKIAPAAAGSAELARQVAEAMTRRAASRIRAGR